MKQGIVGGVALLIVSLEAVFASADARSGSSFAPTPRPEHVLEAQAALRDLGYEPGPIDGVVGPRTRGALEGYQRSEGLQVTGRLDGETMARLDVHERLFRRPVRGREVEVPANAIAEHHGAPQSP